MGVEKDELEAANEKRLKAVKAARRNNPDTSKMEIVFADGFLNAKALDAKTRMLREIIYPNISSSVFWNRQMRIIDLFDFRVRRWTQASHFLRA
jgi:hypothetical protein